MSEPSSFDFEMMRRCIALSEAAAAAGEYPFAAVIAYDGSVLVEMLNRAARDTDVTSHAELMAIKEAQTKVSGKKLEGCTLYSTVEPCVMCAFPIRETRIDKVVFAIKSRLMGGNSRWDVLRDSLLSDSMPEYFGPPPEILGGVLCSEAEAVWERWNPEIWAVLRGRGRFGADPEKR